MLGFFLRIRNFLKQSNFYFINPKMIIFKKEEDYEFLKNKLLFTFMKRKYHKCGSKTNKMKE